MNDFIEWVEKQFHISKERFSSISYADQEDIYDIWQNIRKKEFEFWAEEQTK